MVTTRHGPLGPDPENLYTVSAGGFSATADAFARDPDNRELWFLSMVGSQTALKAIWASLLKQPPEPAHLIRGVDGGELTGDYLRCSVPYQTIGTWTTKISRLPVTGGWHAMAYTRLAEFAFEREDFLLLARSEGEAPTLHHRFLDRRSPLPLHRSWGQWLWRRGLRNGESNPCSLRAYRPGSAHPTPRGSGTTSPTLLPWARSPSMTRREPPGSKTSGREEAMTKKKIGAVNVPHRTLIFDCPLCGQPSTLTAETEVHAGSGIVHHCVTCGGEVVFLALTVERFLESVNGSVDCCYADTPCGLEPSTLAGPGTGNGTSGRHRKLPPHSPQRPEAEGTQSPPPGGVLYDSDDYRG